MKQDRNIHIISTEKPRRYRGGKVSTFTAVASMMPTEFIPNIYITNNEYIGLSYYLDGSLVRKGVVDDKDYWEARKDYKKIILTTDQDLIKDGVQAIDDEFLEWFVKNPNCEYIPTPIVKLCENCGQQFCDNRDCRGYIDKPYYLLAYSETITEKTITYCDGYEVNPKEIIIPKEEPKQETIEETALNIIPDRSTAGWIDSFGATERIGFIKGVNYQAERMYSGEEVEDLIYKVCGTVARLQGITLNGNHIDTAYKKYKKK